MQFYYCNSDSQSPRSFQSTSPVEFYRTSGAGLWQDAEGLGSHWSPCWQQALQPCRGKLSPKGNGWSILLKSVPRRIFLLFTQEVQDAFQIFGLKTLRLHRKSEPKCWQEQAVAANLRLLTFSNPPKIDSAIFHVKLYVFKHMAKGRDICKGLCTHNV